MLEPTGNPEEIIGAAVLFPLYITKPSQPLSVLNELKTAFKLEPAVGVNV